jgi:hypothetical protein
VRREDSHVALGYLQRFLLARGWRRGRSGKRVDEYVPPEQLGLPSDFTIAVPQTAEPPDVPRLLSTIASTLAELYSCSVEQIEPVIESANAVLTIKISSEATADGTMSFGGLSGMLHELRNLILNTTAFASDQEPVVDRVPNEAYAYLERCRFLQTTRGSFSASVELPTDSIAGLQSELNPDGLAGQTVIDKMTSVLAFVSDSVLPGGDELFSDQHLRQHIEVINLRALENIRDLCASVGTAEVVFSVIGVEVSRVVSLGTVTDDKRALLAAYVKFVRRWLTQTFPVDAFGQVVELRSRNPEGNRNYILVEVQFEQRPTFVAAIVNNETYASAVRAHRSGRRVRIVGQAKRMKTQLKMVELQSFEEA